MEMLMTIAGAGTVAVLILCSALYALSLSGHFPREHRAPALRSISGDLTLAATAVVTLAALVTGLWLAWPHLPWFIFVLCGGVALLLTPMVLAQFADSFVNGPQALWTFSTLALACTVMLVVGYRP